VGSKQEAAGGARSSHPWGPHRVIADNAEGYGATSGAVVRQVAEPPRVMRAFQRRVSGCILATPKGLLARAVQAMTAPRDGSQGGAVDFKESP
jgi:hypothetical protein